MMSRNQRTLAQPWWKYITVLHLRQLVRLLVTHFPSFNDIATLDGRTVAFYKRAQLAPAIPYEALGGEELDNLRRTEGSFGRQMGDHGRAVQPLS